MALATKGNDLFSIKYIASHTVNTQECLIPGKEVRVPVLLLSEIHGMCSPVFRGRQPAHNFSLNEVVRIAKFFWIHTLPKRGHSNFRASISNKGYPR